MEWVQNQQRKRGSTIHTKKNTVRKKDGKEKDVKRKKKIIRRTGKNLTETVLSLNRLGWVGRFTGTCLVDSPDAELVLVTLLQVGNGALRHVSLDLDTLAPVAEAVLKGAAPKGKALEREVKEGARETEPVSSAFESLNTFKIITRSVGIN